MTAVEDATIVEAEGTEVDPTAGPDKIGEQSSTAALAPLPAMTPANLTAPIATVEATRAAFEAYNSLRTTIITRTDVQNIQGKEFVTKSGWRKLAVVMGVSSEIVSRDYLRDHQGRIISAEVIVRATAPNGRSMDGLGLCDFHERCCPRAYVADAVCKAGGRHSHCAEGCDGFNHFSKPQHDIPATASTRALNRACSDLFGFGEVSAEEVTDKEDPAPEATITAIVHAMNELPTEEGKRKLTKQAFARQFGIPSELKTGQVDAALRFCKANGLDVQITDAPAAAGQPEGDRTSDGDVRSTPAASAAHDPASSSSGGAAQDSESASAGGAPGPAVGSSTTDGAPPLPADTRESTTTQRRNIGIKWRELEAEGIVNPGDKAEFVAVCTGERVTSTADATFDEAVKILAGIALLHSGDIAMYDDPEVPGRRTPGAMPDKPAGQQWIGKLKQADR